MRRRGLTLVEVLLVVLLVGVAILPLATLYQGQTRQASHAGTLVRAHTHLMSLLGQAESRLHATRFAEGPRTEGPTPRTAPWGAGAMEVVDTVSVAPSSHTTGLWEVRATVDWREVRGGVTAPRRRSLVHLVADPTAGEGGATP